MDASNPLFALQLASPNPSTAQSSSGQTGAQTSTSIQTPQMSVMMQQAAAMQQYQIQQALMMQQVVMAQQAATRAATLKSAAEVAAARAAEISKQLKGSDTADKKSSEGNKSRSVSKSVSPSPSWSKSKSKSRSLSPIRYRHGRSGSRSPIRYRRDYYSPYRTRDYHGYRGYNYRRYYRGSYNDYSRFRYGRDRDYHYRRRSMSRGRRRSRTQSKSPRRSRSRGRKTSLSPSPRRRPHTRSPRRSRKKSISPRPKREGTMTRHPSKRSVSREAVRSPLVSSASISMSPPRKNRSRSPSKVKVGRGHSTSNVDRSSPTELSIELNGDLTASNLMKEHKRFSVSSPARMQSSSSPARSLSFSSDNERCQKATNGVAAETRSSDEHHEQSMQPRVSDEEYKQKILLQAEELGGEKHRYPTESFSAEGFRVRKPTGGSNAIFDEESESDEVLDDWRDDLKTASKGGGLSTYKDREVRGNEDRGKSYIIDALMPELSSGKKYKPSDSNSDHDRVLCSASSEEQSSSTMATREQDAISDKGDGLLIASAKGENLLLERRLMSVSEDGEELMEGGTEGNEIERDCDEDAIFEGPKPANAGGEGRTERVEAGGANSDAYPLDPEFVVPIADKMPLSTPDKKKTQEMRDVENNDTGTRDISGEEKARDRSRSRDRKKHEGELSKHDKRRDRHKKHKKKHKHENVNGDTVDDDGARRRHKRKHKEGEHGHKERKKRKHKHRTKSPLVSAEETLSADEGDVRGGSGGRKKSSKRHKTSKRDVSESPPSTSPSMG